MLSVVMLSVVAPVEVTNMQAHCATELIMVVKILMAQVPGRRSCL